MQNDQKIISRYAKALFEAAKDKDAVQDIGKQLAALDFPEDTPLPVIENTIDPVFEKLHLLLQNTISILQSNNRLTLLPLLPNAWQQIASNRIDVVITTAQSLNDVEKQDILNLIRDRLKEKGAKDIEIDARYKVDLSVISGIAIQLGDRLIDNTLKYKLDQLKLSLQQAA